MSGWAWDDAATNVVSDDNSTTANLTAGSTFTGTWEECLGFGTITVMVNASHASATDGLKIEWSGDGSTVHADDLFSHVGGSGEVWSFGVISKYFRVRYTNGGTNQTSFIIQTILHKDVFKNSSHRISDEIDEDDDADLVKSVITGKDSAGDFYNAKVDSANRIAVLESPYKSGVYSSLTVGTSAVELKVGGSVVSDRIAITMQSNDNNVYWGYSNAVTTTTGTRIFKDQFILLPVGPNVSVWLIADGSSKTVRIAELS